MKLHWSFLPMTAVVSALVGILTAMLTMDIWSAHSSSEAMLHLETHTRSVQGTLQAVQGQYQTTTERLASLEQRIDQAIPPRWWTYRSTEDPTFPR